MSKEIQCTIWSHEISLTDRNRLRSRIRFSEKVGFEFRMKQ